MIEQILQADRLLQVDQVAKARDIYQRVVEVDPRNAIATVGLAQCALADGDDVRAHELAAMALTIDPENDMARRMEARLREILATRGQEVERPRAAATPGPREMRPSVAEGAPALTTADTQAASAGGSAPPPSGSASPPSRGAPRSVEPATTPPNPRTVTQSMSPAPSTRPAMRKSIFDRLLGR